MNFTHLLAFYEVARAGSVSVGAARLHVSQPAVTREIKALEARLGVTLFDRLPRGVALTEAGHALNRYATQIFALSQAAESEMRELAGLDAGDLPLSASATVGVYLVPERIAQFNARHPGVKLSLTVTNTQEVERSLLDHRCALGFIEGPYDEQVFDAAIIGEDELVAVVAAGHPLCGKSVRARELLHNRLILREAGSGTRAVVEEAFIAQGLVITPLMAVSSTEAIKRVLVAKQSIAWLSALAVREEVARGELSILTVEDMRIARALQMIWPKGRSFAPSARAFIAMCFPEVQVHAA